MKLKIIFFVVMLCIFSLSAQAVIPGRIYYNEPKNIFQYIIQKGDTFYDISRLFNINLIRLKELNNKLNPKALKTGTKVNISINQALSYYVVQIGDTIWEIGQEINLTEEDIIAYNKIKNPDKIIPGEVILTPQVIKSNNNIKVMQFDKINGGVHVSGVAKVFEATVNYAIENKSGDVLEEGVTMASIGGPKWGKFDFEVCYMPNNTHYIVIFTTSARDGTRQNEIKLKL